MEFTPRKMDNIKSQTALGSGGVTLVLASPHSIPLLGDTGHLLSDLDYRPYLEV